MQSAATREVYPTKPGLPSSRLLPLFWPAALLAVCYGPVLAGMAQQWATNEEMSHGAFVPIFVGFVLWQRRQRLGSLTLQPGLWGLALMILGGIIVCVGPPGTQTFTFLTRSAFFLSIVGLIVYTCGFAWLRALTYPLLLLPLMVPLPGFLYSQITVPLQLFASILAERMLELSGWSVLREGNILHLVGQTLSVAEACSGLRSLLSLTFLGQVCAYLFDDRVWMRAVLALLMLPIAICSNAGRIVLTAYAGAVNPEWTHGTMHDLAGWIVFVIAFALLLAAHKAILVFWPGRNA